MTDDLKQLCNDVEERAGIRMETKRDYKILSELIAQELNETLSYSTLMRIWGYRLSLSGPSAYTLKVLARYLGYTDYIDYCEKSHNDKCESSFIISAQSIMSEKLRVGTRLLLSWCPNRECEVVYLGNMNFRVLSVKNAKLPQGCLFACPSLSQGEPLYADNVEYNGHILGSYVAGRENGIRFKILEHEDGSASSASPSTINSQLI